MDFINIDLDSLYISYVHGVAAMHADGDRVLALISLPRGTLIMIDGVQPMIVIDGGWLLDGTVFTSVFTLHDRLFN